MCRVPVAMVALTFLMSGNTALAIDCLSYLAADTALEKAENDAYAAFRKTVRSAEAVWQGAVQHREAAWQAAGKAASAALSGADASYRSALDSSDQVLREAKADADAVRELAVANAWTVLTETIDKARTEIVGSAQTQAFRQVWTKYRQATRAALTSTTAVPDYTAIVKEFREARVALNDALAKAPADARARYNEIWIAAEVKHKETLSTAIKAQANSYKAANAAYDEALTRIRPPSDSGAVQMQAGKDAYNAYWRTIHDAYFAYRNVLNPAEANLTAAEDKAKEDWKQAYIDIYQHPNIGLQRNVSGETKEKLFSLAEAERRLCPY